MPDASGHERHSLPPRWNDAFAALPLDAAPPQARERLRAQPADGKLVVDYLRDRKPGAAQVAMPRALPFPAFHVSAPAAGDGTNVRRVMVIDKDGRTQTWEGGKDDAPPAWVQALPKDGPHAEKRVQIIRRDATRQRRNKATDRKRRSPAMRGFVSHRTGQGQSPVRFARYAFACSPMKQRPGLEPRIQSSGANSSNRPTLNRVGIDSASSRSTSPRSPALYRPMLCSMVATVPVWTRLPSLSSTGGSTSPSETILWLIVARCAASSAGIRISPDCSRSMRGAVSG